MSPKSLDKGSITKAAELKRRKGLPRALNHRGARICTANAAAGVERRAAAPRFSDFEQIG